MCGLVAIIGRQGQAVPEAALQRGIDALVHRGPDDAGRHVDGPVAFGFRRLSIIDTSLAGHQPMDSADGALTIVFNGEIYNYVEIRAELVARGHRFRSASDTEVLLAAYSEWGEDCVKRFNGMWAFVIHDRRDGSIFCARDRLGVKPLYLWQDEAWLVLASEPPAIGATGLAPMQPDWRRLADAIRFERMDHDGGTCFAGVRQLRAGHSMRLDARGAMSERPFWQLPDEPTRAPARSQTEWIDELGALVTDAVRLRLRSDVPVGFTLSGGIDSSLLICEAALQRRDQGALLAFSYQDPAYDECTPIADTVARTGASLSVVKAAELDVCARLPEVLRVNGEPVHSLAAIANHALFERARSQGVKVLLGGQGADEVFAGYGNFQWDRWHTLLSDGRIRALLDDVRGHVAHHGGATAAWLARTVTRSLRIALSGLAPYRSLRDARVPARQSAMHAIFAPDFLRGATAWSTRPADMRLHAAQHRALRQWPLPMYLRIEDRLSMGCSVEARLPFTDFRLVEHALKMPDELKFTGGINKLALRRVAERRVPPSVTSRLRKYGFPVKGEQATVDALHRLCRSLASDRGLRERGIYDLAAVDALLKAPARPQDVDALFHLAQTELWLSGLGARRALH